MIDPGHFASLLLSAFLVGLLGAGHCTAVAAHCKRGDKSAAHGGAVSGTQQANQKRRQQQ